ncbi:carboxylating nicotinate-nucleotide diphosphorylase [Gluconobacter wancherniae]|uniref:carboxylating nicotinate-nucleotide diphosphorylase n=1 Tax=Gluconobacter wancherniae TaxID=1307955 RepID=UPI001B8C05FF|nr:carboxylating nicotinate-nucleotide diphosphorylase [Gluconobacter wancherniae]MBS1088808.1 carboxylating nicotinate-nucleotide diphosphorylase [Gluconobacter wancherniae]
MSDLLMQLPDIMIEPVVRAALLEDLGLAGDITSAAVLDDSQTVRAEFRARQHGVVAGLSVARLTFALFDRDAIFEAAVVDGTQVSPGMLLATVTGRPSSVLGGERVALNLMSHLSGIATATAGIVKAVSHTKARVCCTRKTLPGLRALQKYAVRAGGGANHRFRLDDAILIKDNHIALAGGITAVLQSARKRAGHLVSIELEVDTLAQLEEALHLGVADAYLLDNMAPNQIREAVRMIDGRAIAEASGGITPETAPAIAEAGVDILSVGWLTHTVRALDIGLDIEPL